MNKGLSFSAVYCLDDQNLKYTPYLLLNVPILQAMHD